MYLHSPMGFASLLLGGGGGGGLKPLCKGTSATSQGKLAQSELKS